MASRKNARTHNGIGVKAGLGTAIVVTVLASTAACSSPRSAVPDALVKDPTVITVISGSRTPVSVGAAAANLPLAVPDASFTAGSWSPGIIFNSSGFTPSGPVTLYLGTATAQGYTIQSTVVNTDPSGNLSSVWTPPTVPIATGADNYPDYTVWVIQNATPTTPALLTESVSLDVNPVR